VGRCTNKAVAGNGFQNHASGIDELPGELRQRQQIRIHWAKQKSTEAKTGKKIATKRVASMSLQECVGHKRFRTVETDRPVGVAVAKRMGQVGVRWQKRRKEQK
jgi:hypothetical protein